MAVTHLTKDNFDSVTSEGLVLIDFWATWCGPCKMQAPIVDQLDAECGDAVKVCKVDVDAEPTLARKFRVMSIPTLIAMQDGQVKTTRVGFKIENGKLICKLDSKEAIAMTEYWVKLIKAGGAPQWSTYGWELCGADLGAGKAAMMWDADRGGYTQNVKGASAEAGNLAFSGIPLPEGVTVQRSNLWTWSMGMNSYSKNKDAAWYFLQYFTSPEFMLYSGTDGACTDTPRQSVMSSKEYKDIVGEAEGYLKTFEEVSANASIFFTPQPYFFETTTMWAETLQDLVVTDKYASVEEAMKQLAARLTELVSDLDVE